MQTRIGSAVESISNVLVGYGIAVAVQAMVFPWFGLHASTSDHLALGGIFTITSLIRSYALRRAFNRLAPEQQGRSASAVEAALNMLAGYSTTVLTQVLAFPLFGLSASPADHLGIATIFTLISLVRSYTLRRLFNRAALHCQ